MRSASSKTLWLLLSAAGIGLLAWSAERTPTGSAVRPPITAVNEAPPRAVADQLSLELGISTRRHVVYGIDCVSWSKAGKAEPCTAAQSAQFAAQLKARQAQMRPAPQSSPRVVAELPLGERRYALLLAWRARSGRLCLDLARAPSGGAPGPFGPCAGGCTAMCLTSGGSGTSASSLSFVLGGTLPRGATTLRVTLRDGATATYPLVGPILPGTSRRMFLLDLGSGDWRRLDLLRGGRVVESRRAR